MREGERERERERERWRDRERDRQTDRLSEKNPESERKKYRRREGEKERTHTHRWKREINRFFSLSRWLGCVRLTWLTMKNFRIAHTTLMRKHQTFPLRAEPEARGHRFRFGLLLSRSTFTIRAKQC